jgi:hypothetical protein
VTRGAHEYKVCDRCETSFRVAKGAPIPAHKARFAPTFEPAPCNRWKVGDRVKVAIRDATRDQWAIGAADALNGTTGTVTEIKEGVSIPPFLGHLVTFDAPAPTWWANQSPPLASWFEADDLQEHAP